MSSAASSGAGVAGAQDERVEARRRVAQRLEDGVVGTFRGGTRAQRPAGGGRPVPPATSSADSTSFAPCLMSQWQPLESGEWIEPGMANTSRPCSSAEARRGERAALQGRLDDEHAARQPADDPVAPRKVRRDRRRAQRELRHEDAARGDFAREVAVGRGIDAVQPGAHDARWWRRGPRVRRGARRHRCRGPGRWPRCNPRPESVPGEVLRVLHALPGGVSAADDGDGRPVQERDIAHRVKHGGRVGSLQQRPGIVVVAQGEEVVAGLLEPREGCGEEAGGGPAASASAASWPATAATAGLRGIRGGGRGTERLEQRALRGPGNARDEAEAKPVGGVVAHAG